MPRENGLFFFFQVFSLVACFITTMISFTRFFFLSRFQYIEFHIFTLCLQVFYERTIPFKPVYFLKISGFFSIYVRTCVHNCNVVVRFSIFPFSQNNCHMFALHIISASSSGVFKELTIRPFLLLLFFVFVLLFSRFFHFRN